jgi:Rieske Fe-S protein
MSCSRREFCKQAIMTSAGLVLIGGCGGGSSSSGADAAGDIDAAPGFPPLQGDQLILPLADYPALAEVGGWMRDRPDGASHDIIVIRVGSGETAADFASLTAKCTHAGCSVNYNDSLMRLVCPCHGSQYDLDGSNLQGPAIQPLTAYPVEVAGGVLTITVTA